MTSRMVLVAATVVLAAQVLGSSARASTYSLTLADTLFGPESGTGTLTVNGPIAGGLETFTSASGGLSSLSFLIDGSDFTLGNALGTSSATFFNGDLINLAYAGALGGATLSLNTAGLFYSYMNLGDMGSASAGTISSSATPLPATWTMMLIGLAGLGFFLHRRKGSDTFTGMNAA